MDRGRRDAADVKRAAANILAIYLDAPDITREAGRRWYAEEAARCEDFARRHLPHLGAKYGPVCVAGAAAAISPGMKWDSVFSHLAALVKNPRHAVPTYNREFVARAVACLRGRNPGDVLSGPKVTAFYDLLSRRDAAAVVIDGHAWNICRHEAAVFRRRPGYWPPAAARITPRRYRIAAAAYREVSEFIGEPAHAIQAATWLHWRELIKEAA